MRSRQPASVRSGCLASIESPRRAPRENKPAEGRLAFFSLAGFKHARLAFGVWRPADSTHCEQPAQAAAKDEGSGR